MMANTGYTSVTVSIYACIVVNGLTPTKPEQLVLDVATFDFSLSADAQHAFEKLQLHYSKDGLKSDSLSLQHAEKRNNIVTFYATASAESKDIVRILEREMYETFARWFGWRWENDKADDEDLRLNQYVDQLLAAGCDMESRHGPHKQTVLHASSMKHDVDCLKILVNRGANIHAVDMYGRTALSFCIERSQIKCVELLVGLGALFDPSEPFYVDMMMRCINVTVVTCLLKFGMSPNIYVGGVTPLHVAADRGDCSIVALLLDAGADIDAQNEHSNTALDCVLSRGHTRASLLLLERNASVDPRCLRYCRGPTELRKTVYQHMVRRTVSCMQSWVELANQVSHAEVVQEDLQVVALGDLSMWS